MYSSQTAPALASAPTASRAVALHLLRPFWPRYQVELPQLEVRHGEEAAAEGSSAGCSWPLRSSASIHRRHTPGDAAATHRSNTGRNTDGSRCDVSEQRAPRVGVVRVARHARPGVPEEEASPMVGRNSVQHSGERQSKIAAHTSTRLAARAAIRFAGRGTIADAMVAIVGAVGDAAGEPPRRTACAEAR